VKMPTRHRNKTHRKNKGRKPSNGSKTSKSSKGSKTSERTPIRHANDPNIDGAEHIIDQRYAAKDAETTWQNIAAPVATAAKTSQDDPSYWATLLSPDERKKIIDMLNNKPICNAVMEMLPAFENKSTADKPVTKIVIKGKTYYEYDNHGTKIYSETEQKDVAETIILDERNKMMCAALIILGIISSKLQRVGADYIIVAKGGAAVSFVVSKLMQGDMTVPVNDLDFKVTPNIQLPNIKYNRQRAHLIANHICDLVASILNQVVASIHSISKYDPASSASIRQLGYTDLIKLSLKANGRRYIQILDMDFGDNPINNKYFNKLFRTDIAIPALPDMHMNFIYQSDVLMLADKLYYYAQYFFIKEELNNQLIINKFIKNPWNNTPRASPFGPITYIPPFDKFPTGVMMHYGIPVTRESCDDYLSKFKRSIRFLTDAIAKMQSNDARRTLIKQLLDRFSNEGLFPTIAICQPGNRSRKDWIYVNDNMSINENGKITTDQICKRAHDQLNQPIPQNKINNSILDHIVAKMVDSLYPPTELSLP
jgi:hypothetical protein